MHSSIDTRNRHSRHQGHYYGDEKFPRVRKLCSIKLLLILCFVLQAAIPICVIIAVTVSKQQEIIVAHSNSTSIRLTKQVYDHLDAYLNSVIRETSQVWFQNQYYSSFIPSDFITAQSLLYPSMKYSNISTIYYTRLDGDVFAGYHRRSEGIPIRFTYSSNQKLYDQPIDDIQSGHANITYEAQLNRGYSNEQSGPPETPPSKPVNSNFSLATEEWHKRAINFTDLSFAQPFVDTSLWKPEVWLSCIYPIKNDKQENIGVVGADYRLSSVNEFLKSLKLSPNSGVYIVDSHTGNMLAGTNENKPFYTIENNKVIRKNLSDSTDPIVGYIGAMLANKYGSNFSAVQAQPFRIFNTTGFVEMFVTPIQFSKLNLQWTVLVMVSVTDFMPPAKTIQTVIIVVDLVVLIASVIIGLVFAMLITHPLSILTSRMRRSVFFGSARNPKQFFSSYKHRSVLYEVGSLEENFAKMENAVNGFMKYVPREIVLNFINQPTQERFFQPGVDPADITIMFTDIEGFTTISERLKPAILIQILTNYLEALSSSIKQFGGTLDKYIGDAVMALFNCPEKLDDYAMKACSCGLAIREIVEQQNLANEAAGLPSLKTRIGIHTGTCLVGNIGSSFRLSYTAMGDSVNLASRIEALNKYYGSYLLISRDCYEIVKDRMLCRELDKVAVKGKTQGVKIYEIINLKERASKQEVEFAEEYNMIMRLYFDQQFTAAFWEVVKFSKKYPLDKAAETLKDRLSNLIKEPPPSTWDGCTIMQEK